MCVTNTSSTPGGTTGRSHSMCCRSGEPRWSFASPIGSLPKLPRRWTDADGVACPELSRDARVQTVGTHHQPRTKRAEPPGRLAHVQQPMSVGPADTLQTGPLQHMCTSCRGGGYEVCIQDRPGQCQAAIAETAVRCRPRESAREPTPARTHDRHAGQLFRLGPDAPEHPKPFEDPAGLGAQVFRAGFGTGERRPIHERDIEAPVGEQPCGGASTGTGAHHHDVECAHAHVAGRGAGQYRTRAQIAKLKVMFSQLSWIVPDQNYTTDGEVRET